MRKIRKASKIGAIKPEPSFSRPKPTNFSPLTGGGVASISLEDDQFQSMAALVGEHRARRVRKLQERGVTGTLPELIAYDWLEAHNHTFRFQTSMLGGIFEAGAALVDFAISSIDPGGLHLWRIQGTYWHTRPENVERDKLQKLRLEGSMLGGAPVLMVTDIWEHQLYRNPEEVLEAALYGIEVPF